MSTYNIITRLEKKNGILLIYFNHIVDGNHNKKKEEAMCLVFAGALQELNKKQYKLNNSTPQFKHYMPTGSEQCHLEVRYPYTKYMPSKVKQKMNEDEIVLKKFINKNLDRIMNMIK